jgi:CDP-glycerol glycerophosphotransferase
VDVSVVVIVYNDAARLPRAVDSVLAQSLRGVEAVVVDDHSTDDSWAVARQLAAAHPGRVRAVRLPANSGGCGAPRNRGVEEARGSHVMFLDSDDTLERDACRNLLQAALETGADLASGICVRVAADARNRRTTEWYPWLYARTRTLESVAELPDLLVYDTLSTNKCYRRDFLLAHDLRFPVGVHYEDLLFSARAYVAARRITLIPNHVSFWNVYQRAAQRSISNRRHEIANVEDRLRVHRSIDDLLLAAGLPELKLCKDVKFLKHDLVLHLRDLPRVDDDYRRRFADLACDYLAGVSPQAYRKVAPMQAVCAYLLTRRDWTNLLPAADQLANPVKLASPLARADGRVYWCAEHLDDPLGRELLDVTDEGHPERPLRQLFLRNALTGYRDDGRGTVSLTGSIVNPLGRLTSAQRVRGLLEFRARRRSPFTFTFPLRTLSLGPRSLDWSARVDLSARLRPLGVLDDVWDVRVLLDVDGVRLRTRLSATAETLAGASVLPVRPRLTRLAADGLLPDLSARGHLCYRLTAHSPATLRAGRELHRLIAGPPGHLAKTAVRTARRARRTLHSGTVKTRVYEQVLTRLPVRKGLVVFESHLGRQYGDSPRAVYEELRRQGVPCRPVWSYAGPPDGFPADAALVRRWSWPYLVALARAEVWIDNQGFPLKLTKRPQTTYVQTWHGSAIKHMGFDDPALRVRPRAERAAFQRAVDRFDHFLLRSEHDAGTLARGMRLPEEVLLRTGYPRNDALVAARQAEERTGARTRGPLDGRLGIPAEHTVLLYAPTFRGRPGARQRFALPFDVEEFAARFGGRCTLLVRAHYLQHVELPPAVAGQVLDVSGHGDVTELLLLADGLITDYSSVLFDYALLDRPVICFVPDHESYLAEDRGTYLDVYAAAPGPVVATQEELFGAVAGLKAAEVDHRDARQRFVAEFGEYDTGQAARRVVDLLFPPEDRP